MNIAQTISAAIGSCGAYLGRMYMSQNTVLVKTYAPGEARFAIDEREIWRYAGYPAVPEDAALRDALGEVRSALERSFVYRVCWYRTSLEWRGGTPLLPFETSSADLAKCLRGSVEIVMFAATVGFAPDRYIAREQRRSPLKALLAQGFGAERVERLCDVFCAEFNELRDDAEARALVCTPRFSPGYGDLPLEAQRDFFRILDCGRRIGVSLGESLLMSPTKSVTAVFGLRPCGDAEPESGGHGCGSCAKVDCEFRKN